MAKMSFPESTAAKMVEILNSCNTDHTVEAGKPGFVIISAPAVTKLEMKALTEMIHVEEHNTAKNHVPRVPASIAGNFGWRQKYVRTKAFCIPKAQQELYLSKID